MTRRKRFSTRGLGLMDTLAMLAVIALMFSILLPALAKAREAARRSMCADNMRRLAVGVLSYANDHADKGPMRGWFPYTVAEPHHEIYGSGGYAKTLANLGQLYKNWIGGQHDMLYCPSLYSIRDSPTGGWKTAFDPAVYFTWGGYDYGIPLAPRSGPLQSPDFSGPNPFPPEVWSSGMADWVFNWEMNHDMQFQVPSPPALVFDWFIGFNTVHRPGLNVMYTDGHVRFHDTGGLASRSTKYDLWYKVSLKQ